MLNLHLKQQSFAFTLSQQLKINVVQIHLWVYKGSTREAKRLSPQKPPAELRVSLMAEGDLFQNLIF